MTNLLPRARPVSTKLFIIFAMAIVLPTTFYLQKANADEPKPGTINVSATGTATVLPDMAIINLTVLREAATAREALAANTDAMGKVLAAMKAGGVENKDLQTSNFNIQPKYFYPKRTNNGEQREPRITGYTVNNSLSVRIRDLSKLGGILDQAVSLGVNAGGGITFTTDKPDAVIDQARRKAMEKALKQAQTLTSTAGVSLGRILNISESRRGGQPRPRTMARMQADSMEAASPVPVASGENSYSVTVNVQWEISQ